jgi:hypothetical protein
MKNVCFYCVVLGIHDFVLCSNILNFQTKTTSAVIFLHSLQWLKYVELYVCLTVHICEMVLGHRDNFLIE